MKTYYPSKAQLDGARQRYTALHLLKPIRFYCHAPEAQTVCVVGDFNDWNPNLHPLQRQRDGSWHTELPLPHGYHQYVLLVDGRRVLDPGAHGITRTPQGERVSMISVS